MPIFRRKSQRRREDFEVLTDNQKRFLLYGNAWFDDHQIDSIDDLRMAWDIHRDELLPAFIAEHPGRRPFAWWACDHGHERPVVSDRLPPQAIANYRAKTLGYLHTSILCGPWDGSSMGHDFQEPEADYLSRLGLLGMEERDALAEESE